MIVSTANVTTAKDEVIMTSPASLQHQLIASFFSAVMGIYAQGYQLGVVVTGPFQMKRRNG